MFRFGGRGINSFGNAHDPHIVLAFGSFGFLIGGGVGWIVIEHHFIGMED